MNALPSPRLGYILHVTVNGKVVSSHAAPVTTFAQFLADRAACRMAFLSAETLALKPARNVRQDARRTLMMSLLQEGRTQAQIARQFNLSRQRVHQIIGPKGRE